MIRWKVPNTEELVDMPASEWYTFEDGTLAEIRAYYFDTAALAEARI